MVDGARLLRGVWGAEAPQEPPTVKRSGLPVA